MHYDHIAFHTEEPDYPGDLPERNAAHHIGRRAPAAISRPANRLDFGYRICIRTA